MTVIRLCAIGLVLATPLSAQELRDGLYGCTIGSYFLGEIEIAAGQYRGPAFDGRFEDGWYPLEVTPPTLGWGGPVGGISAAGSIVSTVMKDAGGGRIGFDITIRNADSGNFQTVSCAPA